MASRFDISFGRFNRALFPLLAMGSSRSFVELDDSTLHVQLGVGFRARVPRSAIVSAEPYRGRVWGWGAHGWRGMWLVNGSSKGIVRLRFDPVQRARVVGFPVKLRELQVSLDEPERFLAELAAPITR